MVYESRHPAVRLGNDARTKNQFFWTSVWKSWLVCILYGYLDYGYTTSQQPLQYLSLFSKSQPAKYARSFEVTLKLETPLHRYNRDRPVFFPLIGRCWIMRCNAGEDFHCNVVDTTDNFDSKVVDVSKAWISVYLGYQLLRFTNNGSQVRGELSAFLSRFDSN